jgi:hypothetical protein
LFYKLLLLVLLLFYADPILQAQILPIDTDRPDQTESAALVPKGWLQFEAGFNYEKEAENHHFVLPTLLSKYGVSKWFELRLITTLSTFSTLYPGRLGLEPVEVGSKIFLFKERKLIPTTSFLFHLGIPAFSSKQFRPAMAAPNFRFTMQHTLASNLSLGYNLGAEWDGFSSTPAYIYTLTTGLTFLEKWYTYIEAFGDFQKNELPLHSIDGGLAYLPTNNLKIDISSGFGLANNSSNWYVALGISGRMKISKK